MAVSDLGFDLEDIEDLGIDLEGLAACDFDDKGALEPQAYLQPARTKVVHPRYVSHDSAQKLVRAIFPLAASARAHVVVPGTFIYGDLAEAIAVHLDEKIACLWVMSLSLNMANIESLKNIQAGDYVGDTHLMLSDYWYAHNRGHDGLVQAVYDELDNGRFQFSVVRTHGKVTLMEMDGGASYVITGSANLRSTSTIENFVVENDAGLLDWYKTWLTDLESQFFTVNGGNGIHAQRCARKGDQWQILDNIGELTMQGKGRPMRVEIAAQPQPGRGDHNSSADLHPSDTAGGRNA